MVNNDDAIIVVGPLTPFKADGAINPSAIEAQIDYLVKEGANQVVAAGYLIQDFQLLSTNNRMKLIDSTIGYLPKNVSGVVGITGRTLSETREIIEFTKGKKFSMFLSGVPFARRLSSDEVYDYFSSLSKESNVPVLLYNHSGLGLDLSLDMITKILKLPNVSAVKETGHDLTKLMELSTAANKLNKTVYSISEMTFVALYLGITRISSPPILVRPVKQLLTALQNGDQNEAKKYQDIILEYHSLPLKNKSSSSVIRKGLSLLGLDVGTEPKPYRGLDLDDSRTLEDYLKRAKIL